MSDVVTTSLRKIRDKAPPAWRYCRLCNELGGESAYGLDRPVTLRQVYQASNYEHTLWTLTTTDPDTHHLWRHFSADAAEMVEHLMTDERSRHALRVARLHAYGRASAADLIEATRKVWDVSPLTQGDIAAAVLEYSVDEWETSPLEAARAMGCKAGDIVSKSFRKAFSAAFDAQMALIFEYCRIGRRVDWHHFFGHLNAPRFFHPPQSGFFSAYRS